MHQQGQQLATLATRLTATDQDHTQAEKYKLISLNRRHFYIFFKNITFLQIFYLYDLVISMQYFT
jgi:hypothetical protein